MRRQLRSLAVVAGIGAASALGAQLALAHPGAPADQQEAGSGRQEHRQMHQQMHKHKGHRGGAYFDRMARELGLSEQQKSQAKALKESLRSENKELFQGMVAEKRKLRALIHSGSADEAAIRAQAARVAAAETELALRKAQGAKQFLALLTPEQVTRYRELLAKREAGREGRPGRFGGCAEDEFK